jgi:hypothetical protein
VALGAARAGSAPPNGVVPRPPRKTAVDEIVWQNRLEAEPRPARDDTRPVMLDWVNIRRAGNDQKALPPVPPQTEKEGKIYAVKVCRACLAVRKAQRLRIVFQRKPVPSLDNFHDEGLHEARVVETGKW